MILKHELTPLQIDGSKAGSEKARQPNRENDSASTLATMSILYGLSEGVVRGFGTTFTLDDIKKRLYMDGTPVMAADGTVLQEVEVDFRDGSVQQTPIEGMPSQTVETPIDLELRAVSPIARTFNRAEVDSYEVRISIPQLVTNTIDGDSVRRQVEFAIDIATDSGSFSEYGRYVIYEKITQGFQRTYPVQIPKAGTRTIRVRRLTADNTSDLSVDTIIVEAMVEVVEVQFTYPHTALLWVRYDARNYSSVPKMELLMDGKADLRLPANYNPETRDYATTGIGTTGGVWDGTWKIGYSDNPVWHWLDLATAARYGTGNRITIDIPDKFYLYSLARYCDELVPDGAGGYEPRFTCNNLYLQAANDAFQVFKDISSIFRAKTVWDGAHLNPKMDVPRDAMLIFSRANVSNVKYSSTSDSAQHNLIGVQYYDTANQYKSKYAYARDLNDIRQRGRIVDTNVSALGCTSEGQAQRMATYLLQSELKETRIISFTTGLDGMRPIIGDVFIFGDDLLAGKTTSGRVVSVAGKVVTLDRELTPSLDIDGTFIVNTTENFASTRKIVSIDPDNPHIITLDAAITVVDITELVWAVRSVSVGLREYTIDDIEYDSDAKVFNISGVQYARDKYPASDGAARVENAPVTIIDPLIPSAPSSVVASYFVKVDQGNNIAVIDVAWTQVAKAAWYELEMRRDGSPWQSLGRVVQMTFSIDNAYLGIYEFRVRAIDAMSTASAFATSQPLDVRGKVLPPPALEGILVTGKLFGVDMAWVFPPNTLDSRYTRLRVTFQNPATTPEPVAQVYDVAYPSKTFTIDGLSPNVNVWVQAALVDSYGNTGNYTNWSVAASIADATQVLDQLKDQLTTEQLDQALREKIEIGVISGEAAAEAKELAQAATDKINTEVLPQLNNLDVGLTQEITNRQDGDAHNLGELNAYKLSNDNAVAAAMQQATSALTATESNATLIGAVQGQLTNLEGDVQQKADNSVVQQIDTRLTNLDGVVQANNSAILLLQGQTATLENEMLTTVKTSALENYYTKQEANVATAGMLQEFKSSMSIGGVNVLFNSEAPRVGVNEYLMYEQSVELKNFYDQNLNKDITISCEMLVPVAGKVTVYTSNYSAHSFTYSTEIPANVWVRVVATVKPVPNTSSPDFGTSTLEFYGEYGTGRVITVRNVQVEAGNFATAWSPSPRDYANEFDLAAEARANMYTKTEADTATAGFIQEFNASLKIGGTNIFSGGTVLNAYGVSVASRYNNSQGNHVILGTSNVDARTLRFEDVVTEMGWYTVSGFVRGDQGISARFAIDFCDQGWTEIVTSADNTDKYFEVSVNVQDTPHRFMDIQPLQWLNYNFTNIKIEKGNKATAWSPAPYDTADAAALNQTQVDVTNLDGRLASTATQVSNLEAKINSRNGFYLYSGGLEATTGGMGYIRTLNDDSWRYNVGRSYGLIVFRPNTGYVDSAATFDVYDGQIQGFAAAVEAIPNGWYAAVLTSDEPLANSYYLKPYLKMLGGTDAIDGMTGRGAYMLIGQKGMSQGQALEMVSSDKFMGIQYILEFAAGVPVALGGSSPSAVVNQQTRAEVQELDGQLTALSSKTTNLETNVGNNTASINSQLISINGLEARATFQVVAGNTIGGVVLGNNGGIVDAVWRADSFSIAPPISAGAGDVGQAAFNYRATPVTLPNGTVIPEGLYLNNLIVDYIDASKLNVTSLNALTSNFGSWTTYADPAQPTKGRNTNNGLTQTWYDDNNVMRVRIGKLS